MRSGEVRKFSPFSLLAPVKKTVGTAPIVALSSKTVLPPVYARQVST
jgi:hypothetical protein